jgi:hypothetical protein
LLKKEAEKKMDRAWGRLKEPEEPPSLRPAQGWHTEESYYDVFKQFYELDQVRRNSGSPNPAAEKWESLGNRCGVYCRVTDPTELKIVVPYLLRLRLLQAQCHLFASIERFKASQLVKQQEDYLLGIRLLDLLYKIDPDDIGPIPEPADKKNRFYLYNTGVSVFDPGGNKWWKSTQEMADHLLADFCPWGVQLYLLLKECGLTDHFDWRILVPYSTPQTPEVGPLTVLNPACVPKHIIDDVKDIADGRFNYFVRADGADPRKRTVEWEKRPKTTYSICYLSRLSYGLTTSQKVELGWKAVVFVTAGPIGLIGDYVQDYLVESLGSLIGGRKDVLGGLYMAVDIANTADNMGFDKSWLLELKPEIKPGKLAKSLLVHVLNMNEGKPLQRLFSGLVPDHAVLQKNAEDPRTYDGRAMPHVIIRTDVHGFEKTGEDEYPRAWDIVRFYQLAPRMLAGLDDRYDLDKYNLSSLKLKNAYLQGDEGLHLNTWRPLPFKRKEPFGFRRHLTDFSPSVQVLRINIPDKVLSTWQKGNGLGEVLATFIRTAKSKQPLEGSILSVDSEKISWRIDNLSQRGLNETLKMDTPMDGTPDPDPTLYVGRDRVDCTCYADRLRTHYVVEILRCKQDPSDPLKILWERPEKKLAEINVRFWGRNQPPSGKLTQPLRGIHELVQDYEDRPANEKLPDLPFTRCEVNIGFSGKMASEGEKESEFVKLRSDGVGGFKGNVFQGTFTDKKGDEFKQERRVCTVVATTGPRTLEALGTLFPESVGTFTATLNLEEKDTMSDSVLTTKTTLTLSGNNLKLNPDSPLLKTRIPFHRFMQNEQLRRRYGYAFLQYKVEGIAVKRHASIQYQQTESGGKKSKSQSVSEVEEVEEAYLAVTFWFY